MPLSIRRRDLIRGGGAFAVAAAAAPGATRPPSPDARPDWADLRRYARDDAELARSGTKVDCVLMGDSITERWLKLRPSFFPAGRVCRGISGQTTPQMLVRFRADVVELKPAVVHIMGGTNDIAGNTGQETPEMIEANLTTMTEIAMAGGIRVVLASIPPAARYPWKPGVDPVPPTRQVNLWLKEYAARVGAVYADYWPALDDGRGGIKPGWSTGCVHPTEPAYAAMEPIALEAIEKARGLPAQKAAKP